jgi:hypothetical protein
MTITFATKYPAALKNAAWQKSKSFKDKTKSKTKTGLGDALKLAEKNWGALEFDNLIAAKQRTESKNLAGRRKDRKEAQEYLNGTQMKAAINALEAASSKARVTGENAALSTTAAKAATKLSGDLLAQARLLHAIKLTDFDALVSDATKLVHNWEQQHSDTLHRMDDIRDELRHDPTVETWDKSGLEAALDGAVKVSGNLAEATEAKDWTDNSSRWRKLFVAYAAANKNVHQRNGAGVRDEIEDFADLIQKSLGTMYM